MVGIGVTDGVGVAVGTGVAVATGVAVTSGILSRAASASSLLCCFYNLFLCEINRTISRTSADFSRCFLLLFLLICITSVYYSIG